MKRLQRRKKNVSPVAGPFAAHRYENVTKRGVPPVYPSSSTTFIEHEAGYHHLVTVGLGLLWRLPWRFFRDESSRQQHQQQGKKKR
jgi:hypothetical protein